MSHNRKKKSIPFTFRQRLSLLDRRQFYTFEYVVSFKQISKHNRKFFPLHIKYLFIPYSLLIASKWTKCAIVKSKSSFLRDTNKKTALYIHALHDNSPSFRYSHFNWNLCVLRCTHRRKEHFCSTYLLFFSGK